MVVLVMLVMVMTTTTMIIIMMMIMMMMLTASLSPPLALYRSIFRPGHDVGFPPMPQQTFAGPLADGG
jgi:hypothetical protein